MNTRPLITMPMICPADKLVEEDPFELFELHWPLLKEYPFEQLKQAVWLQVEQDEGHD